MGTVLWTDVNNINIFVKINEYIKIFAKSQNVFKNSKTKETNVTKINATN